MIKLTRGQHKAVRFVERAIQRAIDKGLFVEADPFYVDPLASGGVMYRCNIRDIFGKQIPIIAGAQRPATDAKRYYNNNVLNFVEERIQEKYGQNIACFYMSDRVMHHDWDEPWEHFIYIGRLEYDD